MENNIRKNMMSIIFNDEGKILIGKYSSEKPSWTFPKGGLEKGENEKEGLFREIREELGLSPSGLEIILGIP